MVPDPDSVPGLRLFHDMAWKRTAMPEYRCDVHGIVAVRVGDEINGPDHCPECGGQVWKSTDEHPDVFAEAVRASNVSGVSRAV